MLCPITFADTWFCHKTNVFLFLLLDKIMLRQCPFPLPRQMEGPMGGRGDAGVSFAAVNTNIIAHFHTNINSHFHTNIIAHFSLHFHFKLWEATCKILKQLFSKSQFVNKLGR